MASIILICLGGEGREQNDVLRLLSVLLSDTMQSREKKRILADDFSISMTYEMESEAEVMCNLSDGVEKRGIRKSIQQGIDVGMTNALLGYIKKKKVSIDAALEDLDIAEDNRERYSTLLRKQLHGV